MARYSVTSKVLTLSQIQEEVNRRGGRNLRIAMGSKQIFCDLDDATLAKFKAAGCSVSKIGGVKADIIAPPIVVPPTPVAGIPTYSAEELITIIGLPDVREILDPPLYGAGMTMAIIGTGIRETHEKIEGHVVYRKNYTSDPMRDGFDHDTGVCDIALAVVPQCNILNLKVLDNEGAGSEEDVALAIDDCILLQDTQPDIAPVVINLSLGGPDEGNPDNPLRVACRAAIDKGIFVIASAGNMGPAPYSITCPACERDVFALGSAKYLPEESSFVISNFSSRGPTQEGLVKPDMVLLGENISMASSASDTAITAKSGTSFASPFASAMAIMYREGAYRHALWKSNVIELPPGEIYYVPPSELQDDYVPRVTVKPAEAPRDKDCDYGWGLPYGPLVIQGITAVPVSTMMASLAPILVMGMLGMMMVPMVKKEAKS